MKKLLLSLLALTMVLVMAACGSSSEDTSGSDNEASAEDKTITLGVTPWTSTVPPTEIAKLIFEDMGYTVEETSADAGSVYVGLSRGDIDVFMDAWLPVHQTYLDEYSDSIEETATSYAPAAAGLVVPTYMEDINKVSDLKGKEDMFDNTLYSIEKGASVTGVLNDAIDQYGLDLKQVNSSEGGMLAQAMKLMQQEEAVLFYGWRPHTMFNKLDIKILEDDMKVLDTASVHVVTNKELKDNASDAYEFLSNWSIPIDDVEAMIKKIEDDGEDPKKVAQEWIDNNQDKVNEMLGK
ncbi:glycine betaine ABC transporter substrate-binding protein [Gracilibacillus caseinilyticus]|uniref:Glycine betaine ABC transporter substrate-binding protein n=1 Tax=Gracilibacillus caseinilyticus TaxID=2932256 RepID=A0ABY4F1D4_9BACI|nr:glycine betaine ABC transporter substrate-binding protein [Gracilibacillus caseinilyticus]UOQ49877.1 glycine betaine ABC transporter substrate-binding protein [Gracilibacillus caseinilyticus]